ncbi:hypothetical protein BIV57_19025 [Mangrovactinospora gilvigrisea]|uniref:PNPLA domain-containing protein n=1 Tax=Mangrovactinospora gilvigrisea TaxID=1428644 RepID=A0A1J7BB64_9ACTN|nr:patatin-like phospholipase family protein [Mangrovactinospora gilvigrisea]OIV35927.1 hypothetical protein BIV57_19025 [Mangrovactinospora gilvigrisea]
MTVGFVLGGGGALGGHQEGMLRALFESGVVPELVVGTSIGSIQGAMLAANPTPSVVHELSDLWMNWAASGVMNPTFSGWFDNVKHRRAGLTNDTLRLRIIERYIGRDTRFEDLRIPFQATGASIETSSVVYFDKGRVVPALMASSCVPGLWPPVEIDGMHYFDGGLVDSLPVGRAVTMGATDIYVLQLRQTAHPLKTPRMPWEVGHVAFELSRRNAVEAEISRPRKGVTVHVLPSGEDEVRDENEKTRRRGGQLELIRRRISAGYDAASRYLAENPPRTGTRRLRAAS